MTRFATMPKRMALAIVLVMFVAMFGLVILTKTTPLVVVSATPGHGDTAAYFAILKLMHNGMGYYRAVHEVLLAQHYGTTSVFNWRTPAWSSLLAVLPSIQWAQALLGALALAAVLLAYRMNRVEGNFPLALAVLISVLANLIWLGASSSIVFTEVAAGVLILLSVVSYGSGQLTIGLVAAMAALFIRELAAPYILICIAFALCRRNTRELIGWALGLVAYFAYFAWHWIEVTRQLGPGDRAYADGWVQFGGLRFILRTAYYNGVFTIVPLWLTAVVLPAALIGLFAWRQGLRAALTVTVYLCIFAVVGKPFNGYWGELYTPVLMLGLPWAIPAVYDALAPRVPKPTDGSLLRN